jgi:phosphoglycerate dehydrogenase-like enzyme
MVRSMSDRPLVVLRPAPHGVDRIFSPEAQARLRRDYEVILLEGDDGDEAALDAALPRVFAIVGQPDLPAERLDRAPGLRVVMNVEGNFFPNVDYEACFRAGIHVLGCGPAYAQAVAEFALGLAIDLARGISREDRAFRGGRERYVSAGNADAILLHGSTIGLVGYGNLARALHRLLRPFDATIRVFDPWLPASVLREAGLIPAPLDSLLAESQFVFVLATVTADSERLLGPRELDLLPEGARLILVSRAAVFDYGAVLDRVAAGRFLAAIDVWPQEPMPADDRGRTLDGLVRSPHRAGGIPQAFREIGDMVLDDLEQVRRGLPPVRMQPAARELVGRYRNRPVS